MNGGRNGILWATAVAALGFSVLGGWSILDLRAAAQDMPPTLSPPEAVSPPTAMSPPPSLAPPPVPMPADAMQAPPSPNAADANVEVLTRGPIHEAYAMPVTDTHAVSNEAPAPGLVVPRRPPNPVEEQPPEVKPQGDNASWIPGYWSWDEERKDFIWISGVWRVPPPGQRWVPGYWQESQAGFHWVSGYWMAAAKTEAVYLPKPPADLEQGPSSPSPGDTYFWVPGHWLWSNDHYIWVPGYWAVSRPNLVWVYPTYTWCPRGWVYCDGYWDYPLEQRGLMFAPVYFAGPVPYYRPTVCVDVAVVSGSLFCRPAYHHYYYGDYYADGYVAIGIHPWFIYAGPRYGYDPLFCYYRAYYRNDPHWEAHLRGWHDYYRGHPDMRPPHTLAEQQRLLADPRSRSRPDARNLAVGHPVGELRSSNSPIHVQSVSAGQRAAIQHSASQMSSLKNERSQMESRGTSGRSVGTAGPAGADRVNMSRMPSFQSTAPKVSATASQAAQAKAGQRTPPRTNGATRSPGREPSGRQGGRPPGRDARPESPR